MKKKGAGEAENKEGTAPLAGAELVRPYDGERQKGEQVEEMFDSIAPAYDLMNKLMSFGLHRSWRKKALTTAAAEFEMPPKDILDVATGTGDIAFDLHERYPKAHITGIDLSEGMLEIAREKLAEADEKAREHITFRKGDALAIDAPDESYDMVTVAYGVRNFEHLLEGYKEIWRVLRPGGVLCVIELSVPNKKLTRAAYNVYARKLISAVGTMVSGDHRAYNYLPESIAAAPQRRDMALLMREAGFNRCRWRSLTFGAVTFYLGIK